VSQNNKADLVAARFRAKGLVATLKPYWSALTSKNRSLRHEALIEICTDGQSDRPTLKAGLPGMLLIVYANSGDQEAYDLAIGSGVIMETARPKRQGGRPQAGLRDFIIWYLSQVIMAQFPNVSWGANSATAEQTSAVDIVRWALEDEGMAVIDYKAPSNAEPEPRAAERAIRRMKKNDLHREFFDSEWIGSQGVAQRAAKRILSHDP